MYARLTRLSKQIGLAVIATVASLAFMEAGFRLAGYKALYDVYSKPDVFWRNDALLGWSMEPKTSGEYIGPRPFPVEFHAHVRINSLGLRGPDIADLPPDGLRVLVLGDSVVAGFEVEEDKTFVAILERKMSEQLGVHVQVINGGVRGYGTDQSFLFYRERGRSLRPDLVVFNTSGNDLEDDTTLHRARRPFGKPAFSLQPDDSLQLVGMPVPDYPFCSGYRVLPGRGPVRIDGTRERVMCSIQTALSDHSAFFTFATLRIQQHPALVYKLFGLGTPSEQATIMTDGSGTSVISPAGKLSTALILAIAGVASDDGARFLLVTETTDLSRLDAQALSDAHIQTFNRAQIRQTTPEEPLTFRADSHFNERGHARFADALEPVLLRSLRGMANMRTVQNPHAVAKPGAEGAPSNHL